MARVDVSILKEIARVVQSRARVPERIQVQKRTFLITYLDDHKQRIEEALRRHDPDRLNMLFGQLESKVKYQVVRKSSAGADKTRTSRAASKVGGSSKSRPRKAPARHTTGAKKSKAAAKKTRTTKARKNTAKSSARKRRGPSGRR